MVQGSQGARGARRCVNEVLVFVDVDFSRTSPMAPYPFRVKWTLFLSLSGCPSYRHPASSTFQIPASGTMPIKCRHPDGTTHGVHIFCGDVVCGSCERIFDRETEATPMQVIRAAADDEDVAYQASVSDLIWTLYLDDRTRPHDRQKPRDGPWLFPPGSKISAPESGCPPCYAESAQAPGASNRVFMEKPPGLCLDDPQRSAPAEEDRKQEATDEGAPESREKKTSFYLSM